MSDYQTRALRAQLTTTMDSVLRMALVEIMKIFENSLHDHQVEMAQKVEEVAHLKLRVQRAEVKLRECECGGDKGAGMKNAPGNELQREPEEVVTTFGQTTDIPEIDFEVPDDWCAPLGCESVAKQDDGVCPSIRLRSLYIPLCPIPIIKQEAVGSNIDSHQQRKPRRGSSLKESNKGPRGPPGGGNMKGHKNDVEKTTRGGRNSREQEQENTPRKKRESKIVPESESIEDREPGDEGSDIYPCRFCDKVFDTPFGRSVHARSHKRCRGCKKLFHFPSHLVRHQEICAKLKKLLAKETQSSDGGKPGASFKNEAIVKKDSASLSNSPMKERTPSSGNHKESAPSPRNHREIHIQKKGPPKKHVCVQCNRRYESSCKLKEHIRVHTGEKPFSCGLCSKKFRINQTLKLHMMRVHQEEANSREINGTEPLGVDKDAVEALISPSRDKSEAVKPNKVHAADERIRKLATGWQTMGTRCRDGFTCSVCQKLIKTKSVLIEHFRSHTGERPIKCELCPATFRYSCHLSTHKKKRHAPLFQCEKCEKKFYTQVRCEQHVSKHHKEWPHTCDLCKKGFKTKGRLEKHLRRHE